MIGMPGAGKSTAGVILAKVLGYQFMDSDLLIQREEDRLLAEIIGQDGVDKFLEIENRVNKSIEIDRAVIATGGSVVYGSEAMEHLKKIGIVVYLKVPYEALKNRLKNIADRGVVLKDGQTLGSLYEERVCLYEKYADIIIEEENENVEDTVKKLIKKLTEKKIKD